MRSCWCPRSLFFSLFLWMISSSLKPTAMVVSYPPRLIPPAFRWANFIDIFQLAPFGRYAWNSAQIVFLNVLGTVLTSSLVAFGFARLRFPLKDFWFIHRFEHHDAAERCYPGPHLCHHE